MLSIAAIVLILIMVFFKQISSNTIAIGDKLLLAGVFFTSCIFGISIAIYPNWWRKNKQNTYHTSNLQRAATSRSFKGHHPDCSLFKNHIIIIKNKPRCAGCLGLIIGALASIFLMIIYLAITFVLSIIMYYVLLIIGILVLIFVYIEIILVKRQTFVHIILNGLLILSFFIITVSIIEITKNIVYGILTILLCFLWLDTRIHISKYQHQSICNSCKQLCKSY